MIFHVIDRFIIHFFCAPGIVMAVFFLLNWLRKKNVCKPWLPMSWQGILVLGALTVFAVAGAREPFDVHQGDWWLKSYFDYGSWILGSSFGVWGVYRLLFLEWRG